jgi:hypothetical protein
MNMAGYVFDTVLSGLVTLSTRVFALVPAVVAAFLLILLGVFLARGVRHLLEHVMGMVKLDHYADRLEINGLLHRLGMGKSPTKALGFAGYWLIMLVFLLGAADVLHVDAVSLYLREVTAFFPRFLAAVLVLGGGLVVSRFLSGIAANAAAANHMSEAHFMGQAVYWVMAIFSGMLALDRLGIQASMVMQYPHIVVGAAALAVALGAGLSYAFGRRIIPEVKNGRKVDLHVKSA